MDLWRWQSIETNYSEYLKIHSISWKWFQKKKCLESSKFSLLVKEVLMQEDWPKSGIVKFQSKCFILILECLNLLIRVSHTILILNQTFTSILKITSNSLVELLQKLYLMNNTSNAHLSKLYTRSSEEHL